MLVTAGFGWRVPIRRGDDQDFRFTSAASNQAMRQAGFEVRGIALFQIVSFANER